MSKILRKFFKEDSGAVMVLVALGLVALIGCMAIVIDAGVGYSVRMKASNAADAAVLAGARELPDNPAAAKSVAEDYLRINGIDIDDKDTYNDEPINLDYNDDHTKAYSITCDIEKEQDMYFAHIFGIDSKNLRAHAKARVGPAGGVSGVIPIGVLEGSIQYTEQTTFREDPGDGTTGSYGYILLPALDGSDNDTANRNKNLCDYIANGYPEELKPGQEVDTATGAPKAQETAAWNARITSCTHTPKCTYTQYEEYCPRLVLIPVGYYLYENNPNQISGFHITRFAVFILEEEVATTGNPEIKGHYISDDTSLVVSGTIDDSISEYGIYAAELCE